MVLPTGEFGQPTPVRYVGRSAQGAPLFQIAGRPGFIRREDAIQGLRFDFESGGLVDIFGTRVPIGALHLPTTGRQVSFVNLEYNLTPITGSPRLFQPAQNQQVVERLVLIRRDGSLEVVLNDSGLGNKYDPAKAGGWWRAKTAEALGYSSEERPPTRTLQNAVASRQILVKTWRAVR